MQQAARVVLCLSDCQPRAGPGGGGFACQELCDFGPDLPDLSGSVTAGCPPRCSSEPAPLGAESLGLGTELTVLPTPRDFIVNLTLRAVFP